MAYDEELAARVRERLAAQVAGAAVDERRMFGGIAFLVGGHMTCGIVHDELMVRVGPDAYEEALARPHARPMDFTGRPMRGLLFVGTAGTRSDASLHAWVALALAYTSTLPPKGPGAARRRRPTFPPKRRARRPAR